jgi:peptide methionine sulfoxide reductase MsrB
MMLAVLLVAVSGLQAEEAAAVDAPLLPKLLQARASAFQVPRFGRGSRVVQRETNPVSMSADKLPATGGPVVYCEEDTMKQKAHGTSEKPVQKNLLWNVDYDTADRICNFNRHYAEYGGYWRRATNFLKEVNRDGPTVYYDSVTGKPLFVAPIGRSMDDFLRESDAHGWPSFRDEEVVWENMRVLKGSGEAVSADGTHLGHNLPDKKGNRYCINLVSVAGQPDGF